MNADLYERVERISTANDRSKAEVFDEMMRWWLWVYSDESGTRFDELLATQEEVLTSVRRLERRVGVTTGGTITDEDEDAPDEFTGSKPKDNPLDRSSPPRATIGDLHDYDPSMPEEFVLTEAALRDVPEQFTEGLEIDPRHLEIDRYPRPVRIKKCLPVAVLRHETDGPVTEDRVWNTTKRVLGTERYANRYLSNVRELLYEWPLDDDRYYPSREQARDAATSTLRDLEERAKTEDGQAIEDVDRLMPLLVATDVFDSEEDFRRFREGLVEDS